MIKALFFLIPLATAVAMALWLRHARRTGSRRWIGHWLASLAPMALLASLHGLGLVTDDLASVLIVPSVLGVAAFAGGAAYLLGPTLLPVLLGFLAWTSRALAEGIKDLVGSLRERVRSPSTADDSDHFDLTDTMYTGFNNVGVPVGDDEEWDWDNNKPY